METKHCKRCNEVKLTSEFGKNKAKADGLQVQCRACMKEINHAYYLRTPEKNVQRQATRIRCRDIGRAHVWKVLSESSCVDCGEADPVVLEFDHVIGEKKTDVSGLVAGGYGLETIKEEIAKCEVRCANCHRRVTYARAGSWRALL